MKVLLITLASLYCLYGAKGQDKNGKEVKITIEDHGNVQPQNIIIVYAESQEPTDVREHNRDTLDMSGGMNSFKVNTKVPMFFIVHWPKIGHQVIVDTEPGDDLLLTYDGKLNVSGRGHRKYELKQKIDSIRNAIPKPSINPGGYTTRSIEDWVEWHHYLDEQIRIITPVIDSYKNKLSSYAFNAIKAYFFDANINNRSDKFRSFMTYARQKGLSPKDLCNIYDSTFGASVPALFQFVSKYYCGSTYPLTTAVYRKYGFDFNTDPLNSSCKYISLIYEIGIKVYASKPRENFIIKFLLDDVISKCKLSDEVDKYIESYLAEPGYEKNKAYTKDYVTNIKERISGRKPAVFKLTDTNGSAFTEQQVNEKIIILDFWFTGCTGCIQMTPALRKVEEYFRGDTNIVFLSVSVDANKDRWLKSVKQQKYTTGKGINLYTGGMGDEHPVVKDYAISSYPAVIMINSFGQMIRLRSTLDPRRNEGKQTIKFIEDQLGYMQDGPYVLREKQQTTAYFINGPHVTVKKMDDSVATPLSAQTDSKKRFDIQLKRHSAIEPSIYERPEKLLVLSDIEGNFAAFRKLLTTNGVIDENYNWTFGTGYLVFGGDMFDRGNQVTECLWLIYSLEEKAKKAGGYVHFILGNHEVMNLYGSDHYVQKKYKDNAIRIGKPLRDLYNEDSELGRWLRTKNIVEKIGDLLFAHGGMAKEFSDSVVLSVEEINVIARKHLGERIDHHTHPDRNVRWIYSNSFSPFWFRLYYEKEDKKVELVNDKSVKWTIQHPDEQEMDAILRRWDVSHIVTGHTIVADTISVHYGGKVFNTDTKHAEGKSEALLIEGNKFYRVNDKGTKVLLYTDEKRNAMTKQ